MHKKLSLAMFWEIQSILVVIIMGPSIVHASTSHGELPSSTSQVLSPRTTDDRTCDELGERLLKIEAHLINRETFCTKTEKLLASLHTQDELIKEHLTKNGGALDDTCDALKLLWRGARVGVEVLVSPVKGPILLGDKLMDLTEANSDDVESFPILGPAFKQLEMAEVCSKRLVDRDIIRNNLKSYQKKVRSEIDRLDEERRWKCDEGSIGVTRSRRNMAYEQFKKKCSVDRLRK